MENQDAYERLLAYAQQMKMRGDKKSSIMGYLEQNSTDKNLIQQVCDNLENITQEEVKPEKRERHFSISTLPIALGSALLIFGVLLLFFLGDDVVFIILAALLIGVGIWSIFKGVSTKRN